MKGFTLILDAGHGGMDAGGYYHCRLNGKKWYHSGQQFHQGGWFYEGVWNRAMVANIAKAAADKGINTVTVSHAWEDYSLRRRVDAVNQLASGSQTLLISCHANASVNHNARGWEVWSSVGKTRSDRFAEMLYQNVKDLKAAYPGKLIMRQDMTDGDHDKEAMFTMLAKTNCPAVLVEWGFFDNLQDALFINNPDVMAAFARATVSAVGYYLESRGSFHS